MGWQLHLVTTVAGVWMPLAADLTAATVADNVHALRHLPERPAEVRYVLGDQHDHDPVIDAAWAQAAHRVVATRRGPYPHTDGGVGGRRLLPEWRSHAMEHLNAQFKGIFEVHGQVPTKGLVNTRRFALGAVFVYQLTLWSRQEHGLDLRVGLKPFLKAAQANYDQASTRSGRRSVKMRRAQRTFRQTNFRTMSSRRTRRAPQGRSVRWRWLRL